MTDDSGLNSSFDLRSPEHSDHRVFARIVVASRRPELWASAVLEAGEKGPTGWCARARACTFR